MQKHRNPSKKSRAILTTLTICIIASAIPVTITATNLLLKVHRWENLTEITGDHQGEEIASYALGILFPWTFWPATVWAAFSATALLTLSMGNYQKLALALAIAATLCGHAAPIATQLNPNLKSNWNRFYQWHRTGL